MSLLLEMISIRALIDLTFFLLTRNTLVYDNTTNAPILDVHSSGQHYPRGYTCSVPRYETSRCLHGRCSRLAEENLKILDSQVHPLDNNSVPYNFSSTTSPMLHRAARALNLPARSSSMYVPTPDSMSSSSASIPPLDNNYTGHILVSGYHVSYVLPREFPRREYESRSRHGASVMQFMASVDIWVPFLSSPPQAPYLVSVLSDLRHSGHSS